jgi:hypothetical protein
MSRVEYRVPCGIGPSGGALHWVGRAHELLRPKIERTGFGVPQPRRPENRTTPSDVVRLRACNRTGEPRLTRGFDERRRQAAPRLR